MKLNKCSCVVVVLFFLGNYTHAQQQPSFIYPLDSVQQYISLFNALRDNHFHSGFDLKTQEKEGFPILAADDGYVSRIKIQSVGYGKAIYIDHANGYTTVYGHLKNYAEPVSTWILNYQLAQKAFEFDYVFNTPKFKVKKGDTIAYSGNTGRSTGPHVHFEIRNTITEHPLNPLLHGFGLTDTLEPRMEMLHVFVPAKNQPELLQSWVIQPEKINRSTKPFTYTDTIFVAAPNVMFGFEAYDYLTDTARKYMLFDALITTNADTIYGYKMTEAAFDKNRYINQFIHYKTYQQTGKRIQVAGVLPNTKQPFVQYANASNGWVSLGNKSQLLTFSFGQVNQGKSTSSNLDAVSYNPSNLTVQFVVKYQPDTATKWPALDTCNWLILPEDKTIALGQFKVQFNANTFFDSAFVCLNEIEGNKNILDNQFQIGPATLPLKGGFLLATKPLLSHVYLKQKWCWVNQKNTYQKTVWVNDVVTCNPTQMGTYKLVADTVKPKITTTSFKGKKLTGQHLVFKMEDVLSGIKSYNGFLDGKWQVFEYDAKNDLLVWFNAEQLVGKKHSVKIVVEDNCGNVATFNKIFYK